MPLIESVPEIIRRPFSSLAGKFTTAGVAAIFFFALALHVSLVEEEKSHLLERERRAARTLAVSMRFPITQVLLYEEIGLVAEAGLLDLYIARLAGNKDMRVTYAMVLGPDGVVLSHSDLTQFRKHPDDPLTAKALSASDITLTMVGEPLDGGLIDVAAPLSISSKRFGTLRIGYSLAGMADEVNALSRKILFISLSAAFVLVFAVFAAARIMTRPIRRLSDALDSVRLGNLDPAPLPGRNDELGKLYDSYRIMVNRLREEEVERKRTQELLTGTEKMATIGTLAAGLAHEVNSPLTGAMHGVQALKKESLPPHKREQYLTVVGESLESIHRAVSQLLDYSTVHATHYSECNLRVLVGKTLELLDFQLDKGRIEVANRVPSVTVRADAHKIEQVMVNLVLNAVAAMPSGGKLDIGHMNDGQFHTLVVADTGCGIPEENHERIFEPFFTTKVAGKGTGLGLAVCKKIVEQHGGRMRVTSRPGDGTTFFISLPCSPT
ncbi:MAG: HAMP domain-containing protein [Deltaproteobacteria bacterium]|nr:HAMP domain-containing protein [Deltaproteobacteria bacterium]